MTQYAELLTPEQVKQVHQASLQILEEVGVQVRNEKARARFAQHGCKMELGSQTVRLRRSVVDQYRSAFPPEFTFHGRDPQYDRTIPDDGPLATTGSSAPDIVDPVTGQVRRSRSDDIARIAHLTNELPGYDIFSVSVTADDAPPGQYYLSRYYPALKNCLKPVACSAPGPDEAQAIHRLCVLIAGSEEAFRERPFITYLPCPLVSPLTFDVTSTEMFMHYAEQQLPMYSVTAPNAGMTSPLSLTGTLAQCNAEFLAQGVLAQMCHPGTPLVYSTLPTMADMRTGAYAPGAIETGMMAMASAQMARFYGVPSGGFVGMTNAKLNDAQAGFETGMSAQAAALAGLNLLNMGCLLDALMAFDFAAAVMGSEIAQMLKRVARGLEFSTANLALEAIAEAGPGGTFIDQQHTLKQARTAGLLPDLADRLPRGPWQARGALDTHARAMKRVREILTRDSPAVFAADVDARIRARFEGLVAGDALPLSWDK
jgi:trimethylamine--corrinoid protein Co-methyltransferase